ncbi:hypothetical protein TNCV_597481 [Trichonephila clavipes]|nr:hypothetical protein TNCV_597481 [Trichonephila clavipes]
MLRKRRGQQEMSWATIVDFYARLGEVTEIIGSHHDKLLGGPALSDDEDEVPLSMMRTEIQIGKSFKEERLPLRKGGNGFVKAEMKKKVTYKPSVQIRTTCHVISATCTCPAGGTPAFCKHVFALLHAINDQKTV